MSADVKPQPRGMIPRLVFTIAGVLLMVGPPYAFQILELTPRLQKIMIAGIELSSLAAGLVLLYLGFKERESRQRES